MFETQDRWAAVDDYLAGVLVGGDAVLARTLAASDAAGLPAISVSPLQGKLLMLLAAACGARKILEIGTLGGYSTIWLARALADGGRVVTIEYDRAHFDIACLNVAASQVADRVDLRFGSALDVLPQLAADAPFDLVFIDADKRLYADFFAAVLPLVRPGTLIIADNVVRKGGIADETSADANVKGVRRFLTALANERRVSATVIQTVGQKGYDGWAIAVVHDSVGTRTHSTDTRS